VGAVKLDAFGGMVPAADDRLLPDRAAVHSENTWLYKGRLSGIPQPTLVRTCTTGTGKVFRIPNGQPDANHIPDSIWLEFVNPDTDVVRAPVIGDEFDRYYWASSSHAPRYNTRDRIEAGDDPWLLGIPQPAAPELVVTGGAADVETRSYVVTWVSAYGEEGPVSDPVTVTDNPDGSWDLTLTAAAATDLGGVGDDRYLTHTRIYRTIVSSLGVATYYLVEEIDISDLSYSDTLDDDEVLLNNALVSTNWTGPPDDLEGFTMMPNGILVGWRNNELWFSEPYRPHAWPAAYVQVVDYPIVGLGVINQTLVVCTQGYPAFATGINPSSVTLSHTRNLEPCMSRGSIVSAPGGVYYASPNGLIFATLSGVANITYDLISKDEWDRFIALTTVRAGLLGNAYYAFGSQIAGSFDEDGFDTDSFAQEDFDGAYSGFMLDPINKTVAFNVMSHPVAAVNVTNDPWSGELFLIKADDNLYRIDLANLEPNPSVYLWRSKVFQTTSDRNFGVIQIFWELPAGTPEDLGDAPGTPGSAEFPELQGTYGVVRVYADGVLRFTRELATSGEKMRLPSGFKASFWQIELETYVDVLSVQMATSMKALVGA
jgi:hypothetical protein